MDTRAKRAVVASASSERVLTCRRCQRTFTVPVAVGAYFITPAHCTPCIVAEQEERIEREQAEREAARQREAVARAADFLGLLAHVGANPWEHGRATLDNYDPSESGQTPLEAVRRFLGAAKGAADFDPVTGLYLFGDTGCGKTHLAVAALREFILDPAVKPSTIVFDNAITLIARIQDTYNTRESTWSILERRIKARVWILDDLGAERSSPDVVQRLTTIFTERALKPTLVTSNQSPEVLERRHPDLTRVVSRIGPAYFRCVHVTGRDRRFDVED